MFAIGKELAGLAWVVVIVGYKSFGMRKRIFLLALLGLCLSLVARSQELGADTVKMYVKVSTGYLMVLRQGDDVFAALEKLAISEQIPSA